MGVATRPSAWRTCAAAVVAVWAVPVALSLLLLWLPLLCCAVAVVRFRRARRRLMRGCGVGVPSSSSVDAAGSGGDRLGLLQKYLEDQMELVGAEAADLFRDLSQEKRVD
ncbi:uncharacterized protein LOC124656822 [Lolium rigidum]|uniref:uncharacterized protein LOC124656822 n=1 Tax=Lolium rigidum TaxID=89674 RepID=UPI001F5C12AD|nr:uncharacterized protein LOC124656822 [Lolium rigidum]